MFLSDVHSTKSIYDTVNYNLLKKSNIPLDNLFLRNKKKCIAAVLTSLPLLFLSKSRGESETGLSVYE